MHDFHRVQVLQAGGDLRQGSLVVEVGSELAMTVGGFDEISQGCLAEIQSDVEEIVSPLLAIVWGQLMADVFNSHLMTFGWSSLA